MTKARTLALIVVTAHWIVAIWHLFLAAKVLPAPNNHVSWLALILITSGHMIVSILVWKLSDKAAGFVAVLFFLAAMTADLYRSLPPRLSTQELRIIRHAGSKAFLRSIRRMHLPRYTRQPSTNNSPSRIWGSALFLFDFLRQFAKLLGLLVARLYFTFVPAVESSRSSGSAPRRLQFCRYFARVLIGLFQHQMFKFPGLPRGDP